MPELDAAALNQQANEMRELAERFQTANSGIDTLAEGMDASNCVTATTNPDGRLVNLLIASNWEEYLEPEQLGNAVSEAYAAGVTKFLAEFTANFDRQSPPPAESEPPPEPVAGGPQLDLTSLSFDEFARVQDTLVAMFDELSNQVDRAFGDEDAGQNEVAVTVRGATVTVQGTTTLTGVSFDSDWLESESPTSIKQTVMDAYEQASSRLADAASEGNPAREAAQASLNKIKDTPELARELGVDIKWQ